MTFDGQKTIYVHAGKSILEQFSGMWAFDAGNTKIWIHVDLLQLLRRLDMQELEDV